METRRLVAVVCSLAIVCAFDLSALSATGYVVFWKEHSAWWFAPCVFVMDGFTRFVYTLLKAVPFK